MVPRTTREAAWLDVSLIVMLERRVTRAFGNNGILNFLICEECVKDDEPFSPLQIPPCLYPRTRMWLEVDKQHGSQSKPCFSQVRSRRQQAGRVHSRIAAK